MTALTPTEHSRQRLLTTFQTTRDITPWDNLIRQDPELPLSLTQLGFYDAFNTLLLSCENAPSPYWGPKHYLTEELGLTLRANAKPAFVHFWKPGCNRSSDRLISYPVYNLGHTCGKPRKTERYHLRTSNPEMTDPEIARHVRSIVQLMPQAPKLSFSPHNNQPFYNLHEDTLYLKPDSVHNMTPVYLYRLLSALIHATAHESRCCRRPHPPLRELFVTSLAASKLARDCGFRRPPRSVLDSKYVFYDYVRNAYHELFEAARDAQQAIDTIFCWQDCQQKYTADSLNEYNLSGSF